MPQPQPTNPASPPRPLSASAWTVRRVREALVASLCFSPFLGLGAAGVRYGFWFQENGGGRTHCLILIVLGAFLSLGCGIGLAGWWYSALLPSVVPSFRPKLTREKFWSRRSGRRFARRLPQLDAGAEQLGIRPLGSFGVDEAGWGESRSWFAAGKGLLTVRSLREEILRGSVCVEGPEETLDDLGDLEEALARLEREAGTFRLNLR